MITKAQLHKVEMNLAYLFDEKTLSREDIINEFTNLMGIVDKELSKINTETNYINLTEEEFNKIKDVIK